MIHDVAVAIRRLQRDDKIRTAMTVDCDVHHGNGSQFIFYERPDVLFCSIHVDPRFSAPFYAGHADEIGEGAG